MLCSHGGLDVPGADAPPESQKKPPRETGSLVKSKKLYRKVKTSQNRGCLLGSILRQVALSRGVYSTTHLSTSFFFLNSRANQLGLLRAQLAAEATNIKVFFRVRPSARPSKAREEGAGDGNNDWLLVVFWLCFFFGCE